MTTQQFTIFQWCACTFVLYMVVVALYLSYRSLRTEASEYDVQHAADEVAQAAWQKREVSE
jgi:cell division protein FtsL